jgi:hypothetical protein
VCSWRGGLAGRVLSPAAAIGLRCAGTIGVGVNFGAKVGQVLGVVDDFRAAGGVDRAGGRGLSVAAAGDFAMARDSDRRAWAGETDTEAWLTFSAGTAGAAPVARPVHH